MKRLIILSIALLCATVNLVMAQSPERIKEMMDRRAEMIKLCDSQPKAVGEGAVDSYITALYTAAGLSISLTDQLNGLYYRSMGQTIDGITDTTVKKPTPEELTKLGATITAQALTVTAATKMAQAATDAAAKAKNPALKAKIAKGLAATAKISPLLVTETAAQGEFIAEMVKTASTANKL